MKISALLFLFLAALLVSPYLQLQVAAARRARAARRLGYRRRSRVVALVHRQETVAVCGLPLYRYVTVPLPSEIATRLRSIDGDQPVDLITHLPGGLDWDVAPLRAAIAARSGAVTMIVPACALSGGLELAAVADTVLMSPGAVVGDRDTAALDAAGLRDCGRKVGDKVPAGAWSLLDHFTQPPRRRPSPLFLPLTARGRLPGAAKPADGGSEQSSPLKPA